MVMLQHVAGRTEDTYWKTPRQKSYTQDFEPGFSHVRSSVTKCAVALFGMKNKSVMYGCLFSSVLTAFVVGARPGI